MRKRKFSLDQIIKPENKFHPEISTKKPYKTIESPDIFHSRRCIKEKHVKTLLHAGLHNILCFLTKTWNNLKIIFTLKYYAMIYLITSVNENYGERIRLGQFSLKMIEAAR